MSPTRRSVLALAMTALALPIAAVRRAVADPAQFIAAAFKMKAEAEQNGDQPYGAVVVRGSEIVGWGPSRVVTKRDASAHAEREAIRDAQQRLGNDLSGCVLYSTSRPCSLCEQAAAEARIARMIHGAAATDAGAPRS
jgi:tRNA(adenine34) deaminase